MVSKNKVKPRILEGEAILNNIEFTTEDYSEACKKMRSEYQRFIKFLFNDLEVKNHSKILEIGPGPGWIGIWMAKQNNTLQITGLELSEDMIQVANKNKVLEGVQERVTYIHGNAENINKFLDNSFDVVFSNGSLHHWNQPDKVFNEINRVLKSDGIFCINDGRRDLSFLARILFHIFKYFVPKFMRNGWKTSIMAGYTPEELVTILQHTELKNKYTLETEIFDIIVFNKINNLI